MSKYNNLLQPLSCEWVCPLTGIVCDESFKNMDTFISHVRQQHLPPGPSHSDPGPAHHHLQQQDSMGICHWYECQFKAASATSNEFKVHVLFHPHHSYLKQLGKEYQERQVLPVCQVNPDLVNVLPLIEVDMRCQWDGGRCGAEFDCVSNLYDHVHKHVSSSDLICRWQDCNHSCRDRGKLLEHCRVHTAEKVVACPTCGSLFSNNTKLKDHLNRQAEPTGDPNHTCSFCLKGFPNERLLREHTRRHVNTVKCPHCDLTCQSPSRLMQHIRYRHVESRPHECPLCHKTYKTTHTLVDHLETHTEKCYTCSESNCFYVAATARSFNHHMRSVHGGELLLYCCHVCNERFSLGRKLTRHLKDQHGFELPPGHSRFRYVSGLDGLKRLQTVRFDDDALITPELNVYQPSSSTDSLPPPPPPPPSDPTNTTTSSITGTTISTSPESSSHFYSQPSTSSAAVDDVSIVSSLLSSLRDGLTVPGLPESDY